MVIPEGYKKTEVGIIPEDWDVVLLSQIYTITSSKRVFQSEWKTSGIPFYRAREIALMSEGKTAPKALYISVEMFNSYVRQYGGIKENDILITGVGTLGKVYVVKASDRFYFKDGNIIWLKWKGASCSIFIKQLYDTPYLQRQVHNNADGSTVGTYTITNAKKTIIPFPPLAEQQRIAEVLLDMDRLIILLENLIAKKKNIKQGAMQELLTGKRRLPGFDGEWEIVRFGNLSNVYRGGSPRPIQEYLTNSLQGINWIKIGDTRKEDKYITSTVERIIPEGVSMSREVFAGDLLLSNSMSFGRPYILRINGCIHDGWLVIQNYQESFNQQYLYYSLLADYVKNQFATMAAGSGVHNLNKDIVSNIVLHKPEIDEQEAIASILSDMDNEIEELEKKLAKYRCIKQGMMSELLSGHIRLTEKEGA